MSETTGNLIETVEFRAIAPKSDLRGLDAALNKLTALDTALKTVQNRLAGLSTGSAFRLSATQFAAKVPTKGAQDVRKLAKLWGFPDIKDVQNVAREIEGELQKSIQRIQKKLDKTPVSATRGSTKARDALRQQIRDLQAQSLFTDAGASAFKNPTRAGQFAETYAKRALADEVNARKAMMGLLSGATGVAATMPQAMFPVQPPIQKPEVRGQKSEAEREARGGSSSKMAGGAATGFQDALEKIKLELAQNLNTGDLTKVASARAKAASQVQALVEGDSEGKIKQRTKDKALRYAADQERQAAQASQNVLTEASQNVFNLRKSLAVATKKGEQEKAKQLQAELDAEESRLAGLKQMDQVFYKPLAKQNATRQRNAQRVAQLTQKQQAAEAERMANHAAVQKHWETFMAQPGATATARSGRLTLGKDGRWTRMLEAQRPGPRGLMENFRADIGHEATFTRGFASPPVKHDKLGSALAGLNMRDMAANVIKVATWAAAVGVLYKSLQLAEYSLVRMLETGNKMAHLGMVFRGVGGNAQELTADTIKLAAAQGRSTDEAMESAVEWARLGGDKATVNEQVRVSAMAANTADTTMLVTTKQLSALTHIYHLQAADLNGVLGMLTNTTLKYNIELGAMFEGLDRTAAAAKMAGMGLAEVQALIGVVVGGTGQSGAVTGNSIKYILQSLNSDDVQKQLRIQGVETFTNKLEKKPAGQTLSELAGVWGTMGKRTQGELSSALGGRFNAARIPIVLEHYPKVLQLAIDGQLNLNKAQEANVAILDTLKANLAGFRAEWDRMVMNSGTMPFLSKSVALGKNLLGDMADAASGGGNTDAAAKRKKIDAFYKGEGTIKHATWNLLPRRMRRDWDGSLPDPNEPDLIDLYINRPSKKPQAPGQTEFEQRRAEQQKNIKANTLRLQSFKMAQTMVANGSLTDENRNVFAETMQPMAGGQAHATAFLNAHGPLAQAAVLDRVKAQTLRELAAEKKAAYEADLDQQKKLAAEKTRLNAAVGKKVAAGQEHDAESRQLEAVNLALEKNRQDIEDLSEAYQQYAGEIETVMAAQGKYIALAKMQGDVMERLSRMAGLVQANTPLGELDQRAAAAREQVKFLLGQRAAIDNNPEYTDENGKVTLEGNQLKKNLSDKIKFAQADYDAVTNPFARSAAARQGQMEAGVRAVDREASGQKFGYNEAEKLGHEREYLNQKVSSLGSQENLTARQAGELAAAKNRLWENGLSILQRQADVQREIKQLAMDQNKEFMKSFMGAGPAEMLQKLAAFRLSFGANGQRKAPLSQGAFFAMSPEMRGTYGQLNPQFNPQMLLLKQEQKQIKDAIAAAFGPTGNRPGNGNDQPKGLNFAGFALQEAAGAIRTGAQLVADAFREAATTIKALGSAAMPAKAPGGAATFSRPANAQSLGIGGGRGFSFAAPAGMVGH